MILQQENKFKVYLANFKLILNFFLLCYSLNLRRLEEIFIYQYSAIGIIYVIKN